MSLMERFVNKPENLVESLVKIYNAGKPDRFSKFYLSNLGFKVTSSILYVGLFKGLGLIDDHGNPTDDYDRFIDYEEESRRVVAEKMRIGYAPLFEEDEYAYQLGLDEITGIFRKKLGDDRSATYIGFLAETFKALANYADWAAADKFETEQVAEIDEAEAVQTVDAVDESRQEHHSDSDFELNGRDYQNIDLSKGRKNDRKASRVDYYSHNGHSVDFLTELVEHENPRFRQADYHGETSNGETSSVRISNGEVPEGGTSNGKDTGSEDPVNRFKDSLSKALFKRAVLLQKLERNDDAVIAYDQIINYCKEAGSDREVMLSETLLRKAEVLEKTRKYEEALSAYEDLLRRFDFIGRASSKKYNRIHIEEHASQ